MNPDRPTPPREGTWEALARASAVGTNFAFAVGGMALLGWAIDHYMKTSPRALLVCVALGLVGGMFRFIRDAKAEAERARRK